MPDTALWQGLRSQAETGRRRHALWAHLFPASLLLLHARPQLQRYNASGASIGVVADYGLGAARRMMPAAAQEISMLSSFRDRVLSLYLRTPEHPAKYRIVRWLGRQVFPERGIRARAYPDLELILHPRDWIEYELLKGERYEPITLDFMAANLRAGNVAVLAGVNFGQHLAVAARAVGDSGTVIGIDPQPGSLLRAFENLRLNGLHNRVKLVSVALGAREEFLPMAWAPIDNTGTASFFEKGDGLIVQVVPLSTILKELCSKTPRLLLLDVEGFESDVLSGLGTSHPDIILVEIEPKFATQSGVSATQLLQMIGDLGYELRTLKGEEVTPESAILPERNVVGLKPGADVVWPERDRNKG